jgi:hypothetical protein
MSSRAESPASPRIAALGEGEELVDDELFADLQVRLIAARESRDGGPPPGGSGAGSADELVLEELAAEPGRRRAAESGPPPVGAAEVAALEARMRDAASRDEVVALALRLARAHAEAAAFFLVSGGMVAGFGGAGGDVAARVEGIVIPASAPSLFARAAAGERFRGPAPERGLDARVLRALGRGSARELLVLPVPIRRRVVNLLYADTGPHPLPRTAAGALEALAALVAEAYERLILARKRSA